MKLLLTSAGFTNKTISNALKDLAGKPFKELKLVFIPTAANVEEGGKEWLVDDMENCKKMGFAEFDIVDISALPEKIVKKRLGAADILVFGGGNTYHLIYWVMRMEIDKLLRKILKNKIYVGISAGSRLVTKDVSLGNRDKKLGKKGVGGLGYLDVHIIPHLNNPYFSERTFKWARKLSAKVKEPVYALDDDSALKVIDNNIEVVSEGKWKKFN